MARTVLNDVPPEAVVNIGIGLPTEILKWAHRRPDITFHSENGLVGYRALAEGDLPSLSVVDAGKNPVALQPGAVVVDQVESFMLTRGGHVDLAILGAYQVSCQGDFAGWNRGSDALPGVGGSMDIAVGVRHLYIMMRLRDPRGQLRLMRTCSLPITAYRRVERVYTDIGLFVIRDDQFVLTRTLRGFDVEALLRDSAGFITLASNIQWDYGRLADDAAAI